ncbi:hypothetical protein F8154_09910 [Alkaliphilus pronyensis]|uniref:Nicotianamine synthase n=1 Tax=Alkaliphilus pronyensis TaxID=1482732 RepID=A0A6I0F789_9FIRM|nr:hypothetical protein [Alkaliphilus pronyensis]KAB3534047.1 hypothetical protein F8154_09910 [Alkaliphilus pronyensis]
MKFIPFITKEIEKIMSISPFLIKLCSLYYKRIVSNEIKLGAITNKDRVLCIGGGPIPATALEIAYKTGAIVDVIDGDPDAVDIARKVVKTLRISDKVKIEHGIGQKVDASDYSVIHVALQACPHDSILKNVWGKAPIGARILMRCPKESLAHCYTALSKEAYCYQCKQIEQNNLL